MKSKQWTRRVIALTFSGCGAGVLSYLALQGNEGALGALISVLGSVVGFYFGAKSNIEPPAG